MNAPPADPEPPSRIWFDRDAPTFAARHRASRTRRVPPWAPVTGVKR